MTHVPSAFNYGTNQRKSGVLDSCREGENFAMPGRHVSDGIDYRNFLSYVGNARVIVQRTN